MLRQVKRRGHTVIRTHMHLRPSFGTALGRDDDNAVRTLGTEDSRCRGVLQDGNALDLVRIQVIEGTFDAVDHHERGVASGESGKTTKHHGIAIRGSRSAGLIRHQKAGNLTGESIHQVLRTRIGKLLGRDRRDRADDTFFFLSTITNDDRILEEVFINFQLDEPVEDVPIDRPGLLGIADIRNGQHASGRNRKGKGTLPVSHGPHSGTTDDQNGRANGGISFLIYDSSAYLIGLRGILSLRRYCAIQSTAQHS